MIILFPGRHHLLTDFQFKYLFQLIQSGLSGLKDLNHQPYKSDNIDAIVFAVTSSNHSNTRRNPVPFYQRVIALTDFSSQLPVPCYIYGIDDVGAIDDFAEYTVKRIEHDSNGKLKLTPENTAVLCSTPVLQMYEKLGFQILPCELENKTDWKYRARLPWEWVEYASMQTFDIKQDTELIQNMHIASYKLWQRYHIFEKVKILFHDKMIGEDGDITSTRDYNTYVRQMDEIAELKFSETFPFIRSGRIGDIGCAVGSWIKLAAASPSLSESDFYGIEIARHLYYICNQRKENGDFHNAYVFFSQKNAVTGLVFNENSMNTIHTSSLTHEIESYGSREELLMFIKNRYKELISGGVWINRDVVGPPNKHETVYLWLSSDDGISINKPVNLSSQKNTESYLSSLSTFSRFIQFAQDFRKNEGYSVSYEIVKINEKNYIKARLLDVCEFLSKKDYTDNWESEMHETFCFFSFNDWLETAKNTGFTILPDSQEYLNEWIVENRYKGKAEIFTQNGTGELISLPFPSTHFILVLEKKV